MSTSPTRQLGRRAGGVAHDLLTIAELQWQLLLLDLRDLSGTLARRSAVLLGALILAASSLPLLLAGAGIWIATACGYGAGPGLVGAGLVAGALAALGGWAATRTSANPPGFARSQEELRANLATLKQLLRELGSPDDDDSTNHFNH